MFKRHGIKEFLMHASFGFKVVDGVVEFNLVAAINSDAIYLVVVPILMGYM